MDGIDPPRDVTDRRHTRSEEIERLRSGTDAELVRAILDGAERGDSRPVDVLLEQHSAHVRANCEFLVRDSETARDLAQEVMVKAYFGIGRYRGDASLRTWIRRIKVNHCLNHMARAQPVTVAPDAAAVRADPALRVENTVDLDADARRAAVVEVLGELNDTLRIPLVLRDVDGFSYDDIAGQLDIGLSAAKMRVTRAREAFRAIWRARFGDGP